jgi:hypothetical protein
MDQLRKPKAESRADVYQQAYTAVVNNPYWYGDGPQLLDETFNAENTRERANILIDILRRAAKRRTERELSQQYSSLADKFSDCRFDRCGSSGCLKCLRAFQQAKTVAHRRVISKIATLYPQSLQCFVTIIPLELNYSCATLHKFDAHEFNLHLKDTLTQDGLIRPFLGSIDISLEPSRLDKYWAPHWHLPLPTNDPEWLRKRLKDLFPPINKHDYPVDVREAFDLDFLPYIHKVIKINDLLRTGRTQLPELLLTLDQINPLDLMVTQGLVLSAQEDGFHFELADYS